MKKLVVLALTAAMAMSLAACGSNTETETASVSVSAESVAAVSVPATPEPTEEVTPAATSETEEEEIKLIGEKMEGEDVYEILLTNETGLAIKGFSVKAGEVEEYPANMLSEEDAFAVGEQRLLYIDTAEESADTAEETAADADNTPLTNPEYTVQLIFEDDTEAELHAFPVEDTVEVVLKLEDEVAFLEYVSVESGETVSTKEAEIAVKAAADAEAVTAETIESDVQTDTVPETTYEEPAYQEPVYEEPAYQEPVYEEPVYVPETPSNADDGCLDDGLTW